MLYSVAQPLVSLDITFWCERAKKIFPVFPIMVDPMK